VHVIGKGRQDRKTWLEAYGGETRTPPLGFAFNLIGTGMPQKPLDQENNMNRNVF
jgi:hypothetical protein